MGQLCLGNQFPISWRGAVRIFTRHKHLRNHIQISYVQYNHMQMYIILTELATQAYSHIINVCVPWGFLTTQRGWGGVSGTQKCLLVDQPGLAGPLPVPGFCKSIYGSEGVPVPRADLRATSPPRGSFQPPGSCPGGVWKVPGGRGRNSATPPSQKVGGPCRHAPTPRFALQCIPSDPQK